MLRHPSTSRQPHRFIAFFVLSMVLGLAGPALADDIVNGKFGPGALYRLVRPTIWNGALVVYAHGFVSPDQPVAIPPDAELAIALLTQQGFAVAASSFSENGWAVKDGAQRTHQLLGISWCSDGWLERGPATATARFTPQELAKAFGDLVLWTEFGVKPTP